KRLRHASFGAGGMAWEDLTQIAKCPGVEIVAVCDVDLNRTADARKAFLNARIYQDWREMLDKEARNIDSVNVSTPDHMHASIGISSMRLGKHVYGQKPLAHNLHEVRRMTEMARDLEIVTQMGIQIHSTSYYRQAVRTIQDGVIGKIREVHCWSPKSWGDPSAKPEQTDPVPAGLDWDLWLGVAAERPFIGGDYYHPENWRKRLDFGTGTFGDMGCHIFDPVFSALILKTPLTVRSEGSAPNASNWAIDSKIHYVFAGTQHTAEDTLPVTWYDGAQTPPAEVVALIGDKKLPRQGSIFIGTAGVMLLPHVGTALLFPAETFRDYVPPAVEEVNHWTQFVSACQGVGETSAPFTYGGPLTEAVLLGGVASHFPQATLKWDAPQLEFSLAEANRFVRRDYRKGWEIKGLS
ncbi:MAG: Gfo/Idh/MocA family oxidoreductase, partial [Luteolibacter sp.]